MRSETTTTLPRTHSYCLGPLGSDLVKMLDGLERSVWMMKSKMAISEKLLLAIPECGSVIQNDELYEFCRSFTQSTRLGCGRTGISLLEILEEIASDTQAEHN